MRSFTLGMPGALRLRKLQPLSDGDGGCSLVYDVERAAVLEVPEELRLYVAPALEIGNLDEELLGWLASADLLTAEGSWYLSGGEPGLRPESGWLGTGDPTLGPVPLRGGDEVHGWIDEPEAVAAAAAVGGVFRRGQGSARIRLHLDWTGILPLDGRLEAVVAEAGRWAAISGQEVAFELVLDPEQVTVEAARYLAALPVHVRLRCGECDPEARRGTPYEDRPWLLAEPALRRLHEPGLARVTVQCILEGPARLIELWRWAQGAGVRSLDAIRLEGHAAARGTGGADIAGTPGSPGSAGLAGAAGAGSAGPAGPAGSAGSGFAGAAYRDGRGASVNLARDYRQDLYAIFEETCAEIEAGGTPVEFQPLLRIVRRLRCGEAAALGALDALDTDDLDDEEVENVENAENAENDARGADGAHAAGCRQPFAGIANLDPRLLPEQLWRRLAGEDAAPAPPCQTCWARQLCSHSVYVASPLAKEDPRDPSRERCTFWSAEVEMAVRLYHRLSQIDAGLVRRYFADSPEGQAAARPAWRHAKDGEMLGFSKPS